MGKLRYKVKLSRNVDPRFVKSWEIIGEIIYLQETDGKKSDPPNHPHDQAYREAGQLNIRGDTVEQETTNKVRNDFSQSVAQILDGAMCTFGDFEFDAAKIDLDGGKYAKYTEDETTRRIRLARRPCSFVMQNDIRVEIPHNMSRGENLEKIQMKLKGLNGDDTYSPILSMCPS